MKSDHILQRLFRAEGLLTDIRHNMAWRMNTSSDVIKKDIAGLKAILDEAELLLAPQPNSDTPPQLNKYDVSRCKEIIRDCVYHCSYGDLMNRFEGDEDTATAEIELRLSSFFKKKPYSG